MFRLSVASRHLAVGALAGVSVACARSQQESSSSTSTTSGGIYETGKFDPKAIESVANLLRAESVAAMERLRRAALQEQSQEQEKATQYRNAAREVQNELRDERRRSDRATREKRRDEERLRAEYKAYLAKERDDAAFQLRKALQDGEEDRVAQHEKRLEDIRRAGAEYDAELTRRVDDAYVKAKAVESAKAERQTQDLKLAMLRERGKAMREAAVEAVRTTLSSVGAGVAALLADEKRSLALVAVVAGATFGVAASRQVTRIAGRYVEARIKTPALVRETSRGYGLAASAFAPAGLATLVSRLEGLRAGRRTTDVTPFFATTTSSTTTSSTSTTSKTSTTTPSTYEKSDPFAQAVFEGAAFAPEVEAQLLRVAVGAANTRRHRAPFRHALLHGPPGTGKTMFAKKLARCAGMDYAIASGGDVAPLGRDAVTSLHKLFDWAHTSPRGLLLLVDEAEAFVRSRSLAGDSMSEDSRNALNAFLYRTGSQNSDVLVLFASNAPELFDEAVLDRIDDVIHFKLPAFRERLAIIDIELSAFVKDDNPVLAHLEKTILLLADGDQGEGEGAEGRRPSRKSTTTTTAAARNVALDDTVTVDIFKRAAERTEGFSGREVSKLANAWRAAAYAADRDGDHPTLTAAMLDDVTSSQLDQAKVKRQWRDAARRATALP